MSVSDVTWMAGSEGGSVVSAGLSMADSLRLLAAHLDRHPVLAKAISIVNAFAFADDAETFAAVVRELGSTIENPAAKRSSLDSLAVDRSFGAIEVTVLVPKKATCERVVVGQKVVPAKAEHVEDIVEWVCPPAFLKAF